MPMIASGGYNWILVTTLLASVFILYYLIVGQIALLICAAGLIICIFFFLIFFRDPERIIGNGIVSPADGRVIKVSKFREQNKNLIRIAVFMNIANVHVNRTPMTGRVMDMIYYPGGLVPAYQPEADANERLVTSLTTSIGKIKIIQIAGIVAQRIIPYIHPDDELFKGQRIGIIQFGSRVDLVLPSEKIKILVRVGDKVLAGTTTIANII